MLLTSHSPVFAGALAAAVVAGAAASSKKSSAYGRPRPELIM